MSAGHRALPHRISALRDFHRSSGRMPSFSELGRLVGLRSKHAVWKLVKRLEAGGVVARDGTGRLIPGSKMGAVKLLGTVEAGFPGPADEGLLETISLDHWLVRNREASFLLKVSGDSMIDAGILPGDLVIVDRSRQPKNGDVVVAEVDGAWTIKHFRKQGEAVTLLPANTRYAPIKARSELRIAGVVTSVIRSYYASAEPKKR
jgi:SOS regulatory protein LexA